jgi:hypothetical protein
VRDAVQFESGTLLAQGVGLYERRAAIGPVGVRA